MEYFIGYLNFYKQPSLSVTLRYLILVFYFSKAVDRYLTTHDRGDVSMKQSYDQFSIHKLVLEMHKHTARHVLVLEADLRQEDKVMIFGYCERLRLLHNNVAAEMNRRYEQLTRTKRYRALLNLIEKATAKNQKKKVAELGIEIRRMREAYGITFASCSAYAQTLYNKYNVLAVFALTIAENVWFGMERILFGDGKHLMYKKRRNLPSIRGKQRQRGVVIKAVDGKLQFALGTVKFNAIEKQDRFIQDELSNVIDYLEDHKNIDEACALLWKENGVIPDTFRPCFATLHPKIIRGKLRVFIHLNIEGKPMIKYDRDGNPRHELGSGVVGVDIGTQTIAFTSKDGIGLANLAERHNSVIGLERKIHELQRSMDRSLFNLNPQNYDENRVYKKGCHNWKFSKNYLKKRAVFTELHRIAAINRKLAINEQVNYIRSISDTVVTEHSNAKALMKKAKKLTWNEEKGKYNRRKRFGRSIQKRCPGLMHACLKKKFESTGGAFVVVPSDYRASQYDCTSDEYIKKKLGQRLFKLSDGTEVQRDLYSSFLLWCINEEHTGIDKNLCDDRFNDFIERQGNLIEEIQSKHRVIMNSGIRV